MAGSASAIYRDKGELTMTSALGYTSAQSPGFRLRIQHATEEKQVEELGDTPIGEYHRGWRVTAVCYLAQRDANTFQAAFKGYTSGTTVTLKTDGATPGLDMVGSATYRHSLSWAGTNWTVSANYTLGFPLPDESIYFGLAQEQYVPILIKFYPDASDDICVISATP